MKYLVTYDLMTPGKDYSDLTAAIKALGRWQHPMLSVWFLDTTQNAVAVRDALWKVMDSNDRLFVMALSEWAANGLGSDLYAWLKGQPVA